MSEYNSDFVIKSTLREKISSSGEFQVALEQLKQNLLDFMVESAFRKIRSGAKMQRKEVMQVG